MQLLNTKGSIAFNGSLNTLNGLTLFKPMKVSPVLIAPLVDSCMLIKGDVIPTFSRSTTGTYIDSEGVLQTAEINEPRFQDGGILIEPSSTNLFLNSSAPVTQNITLVNGSSYTVWGTGSGSVVLSGAGSGTVTSSSPRTFTATGTTLACTVTNMLTVQVELGSKTSYIPTGGTPVTRTTDDLSYDVEDAITQGQGSLYCEFKLNATQSGYYRLLYLSDGTTSNRIYMYVNTGGAINTIVVASGATTGGLNGSLNANTEGAIYKVMLTYEDDNMKLYANGELISSDSSGSIPTISPAYLNVGSSYGGSYAAIGEFKNVKYFKEVLSESEAIRITS